MKKITVGIDSLPQAAKTIQGPHCEAEKEIKPRKGFSLYLFVQNDNKKHPRLYVDVVCKDDTLFCRHEFDEIIDENALDPDHYVRAKDLLSDDSGLSAQEMIYNSAISSAAPYIEISKLGIGRRNDSVEFYVQIRRFISKVEIDADEAQEFLVL